jgi:hypothetical protein
MCMIIRPPERSRTPEAEPDFFLVETSAVRSHNGDANARAHFVTSVLDSGLSANEEGGGLQASFYDSAADDPPESSRLLTVPVPLNQHLIVIVPAAFKQIRLSAGNIPIRTLLWVEPAPADETPIALPGCA